MNIDDSHAGKHQKSPSESDVGSCCELYACSEKNWDLLKSEWRICNKFWTWFRAYCIQIWNFGQGIFQTKVTKTSMHNRAKQLPTISDSEKGLHFVHQTTSNNILCHPPMTSIRFFFLTVAPWLRTAGLPVAAAAGPTHGVPLRSGRLQ